MIKLAIVDDEYLVREHLKRGIQWAELGIEVSYEFDNGLDILLAIQAKQCEPDLIFMDICMPIMDGIVAAQKIKKLQKNTEIIMLTGHDDFDYVRESLRLGVADYLSKPIDHSEVTKCVSKILKDKEELFQKKEELPGSTVERMKKIVRQELDQASLSLNSVANQLHMNHCYLSRLFKREEGINFNQYIKRSRMEKAVTLIKSTSLRNYEIAEAVGIEDPNYFSYVFKDYMKQSISTYRKSLKVNLSKV